MEVLLSGEAPIASPPIEDALVDPVGEECPSRAERAVSWQACRIPVPPPSAREPRQDASDVAASAARLVERHGSLLGALTRRSAADFRPLPTLGSEARTALAQAFAGDAGAASLVGALAPLVAPRLERLVDHIRRRLARERALLPLPVVREMDPACLRRNAREPGRTLIEKAGPRQRLVGVRRVPRFDSMENRVLVAAARRLGARAEVELARVHGERLRRPLRRLTRACAAVLARPELQGMGPPRPGERPSNALLGDPDYRAAWRAWQLLRREEERFAEEWGALHALWAEILLLAAWAAIGSAAEPLPEWLGVPDGREDGGRIRTGAPRRWLAAGPGGPVLVTVHAPASPGAPVRVERVGGEGELATVEIPSGLVVATFPGEDRLLDLASGEAPSLALAARRVRDALATLDLRPPVPAAVPSLPPSPGTLAGLCALDAGLRACDEQGVTVVGPAAAVELPVPGEAPLLVVGREATWLPCAGPSALHGGGRAADAELGGALLALHAGRRDTAVVVPDGLDEAGVTRLRRRLGRAWLVWSPVAAALALAEDEAHEASDANGPEPVAFVVLTDTALDVAVLERTTEGGRRVWIRSAPLPGDARGREARRFGPADGAAHGAWLREPEATRGQAIVDGRPAEVILPPSSDFAEAAIERLARWKGAPPTRLVTVGITAIDRDRLATLGLPITALPPEALAHGARVFLERRLAGLPTWKDRLPQLELQVRAGRDRRLVTLVAKGHLVAPGDVLSVTPRDVFGLEPGKDRVLLDLRREGELVSFALEIAGPPLPLREPARVRIVVRYTYGLSGMTGRLVPVPPAPFAPIPFVVASATPGEDAEEALPTTPPLPVPAPTTPGELDRARASLAEFDRWWARIPLAERKQAAKQGGRLDRELREQLKPLRSALRAIQAVDSPALRRWLAEEAAPALEWLLGLDSRRGAGDAPLLGKDLGLEVARLRGEARVRGKGRFPTWIRDPRGLPPRDALYVIGRLVDGQADDLWRALLAWPAPTPALQGEWARAVTSAFRAAPSLAEGLPEADARALMARALAHLHGIVEIGPEPHREPIYRLACVFPWACAVRARGLLPPTDAGVVETREHLVALFDALPEKVRKFGGHEAVTQGDGPVAVAADWLAGRYASMLGLEDS